MYKMIAAACAGLFVSGCVATTDVYYAPPPVVYRPAPVYIPPAPPRYYNIQPGVPFGPGYGYGRYYGYHPHRNYRYRY